MNRDYFQSLEQERLVEVAVNLHQLAIEQWERLKQNSHNSSRPPKSDNPYQKKIRAKEGTSKEVTQPEQETNNGEQQLSQKKESPPQYNQEIEKTKKRPGKQPGTQGKWRSQPLVAEIIIPHYPSECASCNQELKVFDSKPSRGDKQARR